jgi:lipopolysaccharide export system permease protein
MTRILFRYVLREMAVPFFAGTFVLCFVALMPQVVKMAEKVLALGIGFGQLGQLIGYLLPPILLFVVPASFLLGVLVAFGRLSADSEMIAMRAGGVSLWQLLPSVLVLGLIASAITGVMSAYGDPWGRQRLQLFLYDLGRTKVVGAVRERTFNEVFGRVIYADAVVPEESKLLNVFVADESNPKQAFAVTAKSGTILADPLHTSIILRLENGTADHITDTAGPLTRLTFDRLDLNLLPETTVNQPGKDPYEMFPIELYHHLKEQGPQASGRDWMAFHKKFSYPISAILMGIVGMALGISDPRHGKSRGYSLGLSAMLVYYLLVRIGDATGERGVVDPWIAAWLPNLVFLFAGGWLFIARAREGHTWFERLWSRVVG